MPVAAWLILVCASGLGLTLWGEHRDRPAVALAGKLVAATAYLALALVENVRSAEWGKVLFFGMMFCWAGDLLLVSRQRRSLFLAGLVCFLLGHVFYSIAFVVRGITGEGMLLPALGVVLFLVCVQRWLRPCLDRTMLIPVHAYLAAISIMWLLAMATHAAQGGTVLLAGASLFVISDLAVARNRFVAASIVNRLWGLPIYFSAQILLALSV